MAESQEMDRKAHIEKDKSQPHSVAVWVHCEVQKRQNDGMLSGIPSDRKKYAGMIHCENFKEAQKKLEELVGVIRKEIENGQKS